MKFKTKLLVLLLLLATPVYGQSVILTWQDNSPTEGVNNAETGQRVWRQLYNDTTWSLLAEVGANIVTYTDNLFSAGNCYKVSAYNEAGEAFSNVACSAPPPSQINIALNFDGMLRDRVGQGETALAPDGLLDGTFIITLLPGSGNQTVTSLDLRRTGGGVWDSIPGNFFWVSGAAGSLDSPLLNSPDSSVTFALPDGGSFYIFASDTDGLFTVGSSFTLTAVFNNTTTATASFTILPPPPPPGDTEPPTVTITNPLNGAVVQRKATVNIQLTYTDNVGVVETRYFINGSLLTNCGILINSCNWSVPGAPHKTYFVKAEVRDAAGNLGSHQVTVTVP